MTNSKELVLMANLLGLSMSLSSCAVLAEERETWRKSFNMVRSPAPASAPATNRFRYAEPTNQASAADPQPDPAAEQQRAEAAAAAKAKREEHARVAKVEYEKRQEEEKKKAEERAVKERVALARVNKLKLVTVFRSYTAAGEFFRDALWSDDYGGVGIFHDPMATKGKIMVMAMKLLQIVDRETLLLTTPRMLLGRGIPSRVFYGKINPKFSGPRAFSDEVCYAIIGEVMGTKRYTDVRGFTQTVPQVFIYAIGTEGIEGQCY